MALLQYLRRPVPTRATRTADLARENAQLRQQLAEMQRLLGEKEHRIRKLEQRLETATTGVGLITAWRQPHTGTTCRG